MLEDKEILVIGATGFIGQHLVKRLVNLKCKLTLISLNPRNKLNYKNISHIHFDISQKEEVKNFFYNREFDYIFNLAGYVNHQSFLISGEDIISSVVGDV